MAKDTTPRLLWRFPNRNRRIRDAGRPEGVDLGFDLRVEKSELGGKLEFSGASARIVIAEGGRRAKLSISVEEGRYLPGGIGGMSEKREAFLAQNREVVGALNFAQSSVMRKVGRVALRPLYGLVAKGGGKVDKMARGALEWSRG